MSDRRMARADLVTGIILFAFSVAVIAAAWTMDRLETREIHPASAPGVTPGLLGLALAVTSVVLILQALRRRGAPDWPADQDRAARWFDSGAKRLALAAALCLVYALGLLGRMPYWLATALFVACFISVFEWREGGSRLARLAWAVGIGIATGLAVSYLFRELFLVRLP